MHDHRYSVNPDCPIAVYTQIENQVLFAIASGRISPGEIFPSVRQLASVLKTNTNTVTKAFRGLELKGVVQLRRGIGAAVSEKAPRICRNCVPAMVQSHLIEAVAECSAAGMTEGEIHKAVTEALKAGAVPYRAGKQG